MKAFDKNVIDILIAGGVAVIPTDTIYGIVGRAELPDTVKRIYDIRRRDPDKPFIVLISSIDEVKKFNIEISPKILNFLEEKKLWPGKVSIVFPCEDSEFEYLTRWMKSLVLRIPDTPELVELLFQTGPLIAPSANIEGEPPATNIEEAKKYFGNTVDVYVDGGEIVSSASTIIKFENNIPVIVRQGEVKI